VSEQFGPGPYRVLVRTETPDGAVYEYRERRLPKRLPMRMAIWCGTKRKTTCGR